MTTGRKIKLVIVRRFCLRISIHMDRYEQHNVVEEPVLRTFTAVSVGGPDYHGSWYLQENKTLRLRCIILFLVHQKKTKKPSDLYLQESNSNDSFSVVYIKGTMFKEFCQHILLEGPKLTFIFGQHIHFLFIGANKSWFINAARKEIPQGVYRSNEYSDSHI